MDMSYWSDQQIAESEDGLDLARLAERHVCQACFEDEALKTVVAESLTSLVCDYCGRRAKHPIASALDRVVAHIFGSIQKEWGKAEDYLPWDDETDAFMLGDVIDNRELLEMHVDLELPNDGAGRLLDDIVAAFPEWSWCVIDPLIAQPEEAIADSWRTFCEIIKHRRRFFFLQHQDRALERAISQAEAAYDVPQLLSNLADFATRKRLFETIPAGAVFVRAQQKQKEQEAFSPRRMGPPPEMFALQPNRMSPSGVPMFYGAQAQRTALMEIASGPAWFAIAEFSVQRNLTLLDLRKPPRVPSLFDPALAKDRPFAMFMAEFVKDFQAPISPEKGRSHVEYVPTQVVTEYFRTIARFDDKPIDGVLYESTKDVGATAVVLFADNGDVEDAAADAAEPYRAKRDTWLVMTRYAEEEYCPPDGPAIAPTGDVLLALGLDARTEPLSLIGPSAEGPASLLVFHSAGDWAAHLAKIDIDPRIPLIVKAKFERARRLYLMAWVDADLIKAGELAALVALELALKDRVGAKVAAKNRSFAGMLKHLVEVEGLTDDKIPVIVQYGGTAVGFLTGENQPTLAERRNGMAHGDPFGGLPVGGLLELTRDLIDFVYRDYLAEVGELVAAPQA